jgi:hypothetical protein
MAPPVDINYIAVLVAAIVSFVIGGLWYSPVLFGNLWMKLNKITQAQISAAKKKSMSKNYIGQFIVLLVTAYVLAYGVDFAQATTIGAGIQAGFWIWLGFVATFTFGSVLWQGKSFKLWVLDNAHNLLSLAVSGAILAVWV